MVAASKGGCHTCGVDLDGALRCWGCNERGEVGPVPEVAGGWIDVSAGKRFTCGVASADRAVRCWGRFLPQMRGAWFGPWAAVTAGEDWVCALRRDDRTAHCRGWSPTGQTDVPTTLRTVAFDALSAGFQHTCGVVASDKSLACWGADFFGEASAFPGPGVSGPGVSTRTLPVEDPTDPRGAMGRRRRGYTTNVRRSRGAARALECWGERESTRPWRPPRSTNTDSCHARGGTRPRGRVFVGRGRRREKPRLRNTRRPRERIANEIGRKPNGPRRVERVHARGYFVLGRRIERADARAGRVERGGSSVARVARGAGRVAIGFDVFASARPGVRDVRRDVKRGGIVRRRKVNRRVRSCRRRVVGGVRRGVRAARVRERSASISQTRTSRSISGRLERDREPGPKPYTGRAGGDVPAQSVGHSHVLHVAASIVSAALGLVVVVEPPSSTSPPRARLSPLARPAVTT